LTVRRPRGRLAAAARGEKSIVLWSLEAAAARVPFPDLPAWNRLGYGNNAVEVIYVDVR
jgi:hypothetical protein